MPFIEIKDFNVLIENKPFFDQAVKHKQEAYEKLVELLRTHDCTTGNVLDYLYHQNYYKLISIDLLSKKIQLFLNKLISLENKKKMMVQQCKMAFSAFL